MRAFHEIGADLAALHVDAAMTDEQAREVARILGSVEAFWQFDAMAGSGSRRADEYAAWKVRRARNLSAGATGKSAFFAALAELD